MNPETQKIIDEIVERIHIYKGGAGDMNLDDNLRKNYRIKFRELEGLLRTIVHELHENS